MRVIIFTILSVKLMTIVHAGVTVGRKTLYTMYFFWQKKTQNVKRINFKQTCVYDFSHSRDTGLLSQKPATAYSRLQSVSEISL